jgi:hypothetical protein
MTAQQRGLAAARGSEEADELALVDVETYAIERDDGAVALGDVA